MNALLEIQKAIYARLNGDTALAGQVSGVFDHVPQDTAYPYVAIGDADMQDWSTTTTTGYETTLDMAVYSRAGGRKQTLDILARIHTLLHEVSLSVTGQSYVLGRFENASVQLLGDGVTYRGQMRLRLFSMEAI